jgi:hypothetical protein
VHMNVEGARLLRRKLTVEVGVEFCLPKLTNHEFILFETVAVGHRVTFFWLAIIATSPYLVGMESVSAISWYDISSTSHRKRTSRKYTGNSSIALCISWRFDRSIRTVSGVLPSTGSSGPSSSESRDRVIVAFNPVRDVKNVLRKMRYIHARKLVPKRNDENPFNALA